MRPPTFLMSKSVVIAFADWLLNEPDDDVIRGAFKVCAKQQFIRGTDAPIAPTDHKVSAIPSSYRFVTTAAET